MNVSAPVGGCQIDPNVFGQKKQIMSIDVKVPRKPLLYATMDRPLVDGETLVYSCDKSNLNPMDSHDRLPTLMSLCHSKIKLDIFM